MQKSQGLQSTGWTVYLCQRNLFLKIQRIVKLLHYRWGIMVSLLAPRPQTLMHKKEMLACQLRPRQMKMPQSLERQH